MCSGADLVDHPVLVQQHQDVVADPGQPQFDAHVVQIDTQFWQGVQTGRV